MTPQIDSTYNNHDYYNHGYYMFVDRQSELERLNQLIGCRRHGTSYQLLLVYGRRRIGKSALLEHWGQQSKLRYIHWSVQQVPANLQRQSLFSRILNVPAETAPTFTSWEDLWDAAIDPLNLEPTILDILKALSGSEDDWEVVSMFFSRRGLTTAAEKYFKENGGTQITAKRLVAGLP